MDCRPPSGSLNRAKPELTPRGREPLGGREALNGYCKYGEVYGGSENYRSQSESHALDSLDYSQLGLTLRRCCDPPKRLGRRWPLRPAGRAQRLWLGSPGSWRLEELIQLRLRRPSRAEGRCRLAGGNTRNLALNGPPRTVQQR